MISVIMPTYDRGYVIGRALESIFAQTFTDYEVVVVDDGSADGTEEVIRDLGRPNLRYVRHERNLGVAAARNTGLKHAQGDLIAFLDSDDEWKPDILERELRLLEERPDVGLVFADVDIVEWPSESASVVSGTRLMPEFSKLLPSESSGETIVLSARQMHLMLLQEIPAKTIVLLVRREVFGAAGEFDETLYSGEDWEFLLRASASTTFAYLDTPLATQHRLPDATHRVSQADAYESLFRRVSAQRRGHEGDPEAFAAASRGMSQLANHSAWHHKRMGRASRACAMYWAGFRATRDPGLALRAALAFLPFRAQRVILRRPDVSRT